MLSLLLVLISSSTFAQSAQTGSTKQSNDNQHEVHTLEMKRPPNRSTAITADQGTERPQVGCALSKATVVSGTPLRIKFQGFDYGQDVVAKQRLRVSNAKVPEKMAFLDVISNQEVELSTSRLKPGKYELTLTRKEYPLCSIEFRIVADDGAAATQKENYQVVQIWYATDRRQGSSVNGVQIFKAERNPRGTLILGKADISIPRDHRMGQLERPSWRRFEFREDPQKHVVMVSSITLNQKQFLSEMRRKVSANASKEALIFVPGFNVDFEEAARRLGQMTYDLGFGGAPILYSWPSRGTLAGYLADEATIEWTTPHFQSFLRMISDRSGASTIYLIAHSMGNRLVAGALKTSADQKLTRKKVLKEVVMAAPDIDEGSFQQMASVLATTAGRFTIYESSRDLALIQSHRIHANARLGDTEPSVHIVPGFDCIEASSVDTELVGRSYYADNASILADMFQLFRGRAPGDRFRLVRKKDKEQFYWAFRP